MTKKRQWWWRRGSFWCCFCLLDRQDLEPSRRSTTTVLQRRSEKLCQGRIVSFFQRWPSFYVAEWLEGETHHVAQCLKEKGPQVAVFAQLLAPAFLAIISTLRRQEPQTFTKQAALVRPLPSTGVLVLIPHFLPKNLCGEGFVTCQVTTLRGQMCLPFSSQFFPSKTGFIGSDIVRGVPSFLYIHVQYYQ